MAKLTFLEKNTLDNILEMKDGYLLDFSNKTFQEFMNDFDIDLGLEKYTQNGDSKAKRFKEFLKLENNKVVADVLNSLIEYTKIKKEIPQIEKDVILKLIDKLENKKKSVKERNDDINLWERNKFKIFLSHKAKDKVEATKLKENLSLYGIDCFVAHQDIEPTREWQEEIEKALNSMDMLIALITNKFLNSYWTNQEVGWALGRGIKVIPVNLGENPKGFIAKYQVLTTNKINLHENLLKHIMKDEKMIDIYINSLSKCNSFDNGNKLALALPNINNLTNKQVDRIIDIFNSNDQLHWSHGFTGSKSREYGKGLVFYLNKITNKKYKMINNDSGNRIEEV